MSQSVALMLFTCLLVAVTDSQPHTVRNKMSKLYLLYIYHT